jgi:hypothetical protein
MPFPILLPIAASQIHTAILRIRNCFTRGLVFTTRDFTMFGNRARKARFENKGFAHSHPAFAPKTYSK